LANWHEVVELPPFTRNAAAIWSEAEIAELISYVARNPDAGDLIPQTGGCRKLRWGRAGQGKRGGARVITFFYAEGAPVFLLNAYAKGAQATMSEAEKAAARQLARMIKERLRAGSAGPG
jgi:hypothetical protein